MKTAIIYASKYGCTEKCVNMLSKELKGEAELINIKKTNNIDLSKYDKVIIGGSIYIGKIQKEITEFCNKNLDSLKTKNVGLFICGMQQGEAIKTELEQNFPKELLDVAKTKKYFGGEFIIHKVNFMEKMIIKKVAKVTEDKSFIIEKNIHEFADVMNAI